MRRSLTHLDHLLSPFLYDWWNDFYILWYAAKNCWLSSEPNFLFLCRMRGRVSRHIVDNKITVSPHIWIGMTSLDSCQLSKITIVNCQSDSFQIWHVIGCNNCHIGHCIFDSFVSLTLIITNLSLLGQVHVDTLFTFFGIQICLSIWH